MQGQENCGSLGTPQASQGDESVLERGLSSDLEETHESLDADNLFFDQNEALKSDLVKNGITVQGTSMQNSFLEQLQTNKVKNPYRSNAGMIQFGLGAQGVEEELGPLRVKH